MILSFVLRSLNRFRLRSQWIILLVTEDFIIRRGRRQRAQHQGCDGLREGLFFVVFQLFGGLQLLESGSLSSIDFVDAEGA